MRIWNRIHISVRAGSCFLIAVILMTVPIQWVLSWLLATAVHEFSHYLALKFFRIQIYGLVVSPRGMQIETEPMSLFQEFVCACAGPIGAISFLLSAKQLPCVAICACCQSLYNLLPIGSLDGGRAIRCVAEAMLQREKAEKLCRCIEKSVMILLTLAAIYGFLVINLGILPLIGALCLLFPGDRIKIPCKDGYLGVQYNKRNQRGI